jgi:hypothetical protein
MKTYAETGLRFFDAETFIAKTYDMQSQRLYWVPASEVCRAIGVPVTRGAAIQVGNWAAKNAIAKRKSNGISLLLMPQLRSDATTIQPCA